LFTQSKETMMKRESRLLGILALGASALLAISTSAARAQDQEKPAPAAGGDQVYEAVLTNAEPNQAYLVDYYNALFKPSNTLVARNDANIAELARVHGGLTFNCASCHSGAQVGELLARDGAADQKIAWQNAAQNSFPYWISLHRDPADTALGATLEPVDEGLRAQLGLETKTGLVVSALADGGPAANTGLKQNDILLMIADAPLAEAADLPKQLKAAGEKEVSLKLLRSGKPLTLRVRPIARMTLAPAAPEKVDYYIGVSASPPDEVLRAHVQLPDGQGLLVTEVVPKSPAEKSGVKKFDILLKLDDKPLDRTETLSAQVQAVADKAATLILYRGGKPLSISVKPEPRQTTTAREGPMHDAVRLWSVANPQANTFKYSLNTVTANPTGNPPQTFTYTYPHPVQSLFKEATKNQAATTTTATDPTAQRLDKLDKQIQAIQSALDELKDTLKKDK
jgi:membrane-associated protease RseP (regulator of RpoE activity)